MDVKRIAVLAGDGIGPEVVKVAVAVLKAVAERCRLHLEFQEALVGGAAYEAVGHPLPPKTLSLCRSSDGVLFGAVGGPKYDNLEPPDIRPERGGLLPLRKELNLFANLRPARLYPALASATSLKPELAANGLDMLVVRELLGGIYFGQPKGRSEDGRRAVDTSAYEVSEIERIAHVAFQAARRRSKRVCSVDKANVLETSRLWREVVARVAESYPDVELSHMLVDNCAMQLVRNPAQFDVILTENMFGDILSDEAAMLTGSLGMLASASLSSSRPGLYEPVHGSAPDIAGQNKANPLAAILSAALLLRYSLDQEEAATMIERAVDGVLQAGYRTADIATANQPTIGTCAMGQNVIERLGAE